MPTCIGRANQLPRFRHAGRGEADGDHPLRPASPLYWRSQPRCVRQAAHFWAEGCTARYPDSRSFPLCPFSPVHVSDLDRPFRHPVVMVNLSVTRIHHLMIMVRSVRLGLGEGWSAIRQGLQRVPQKPHNSATRRRIPTDDTAHSRTLVTSVKGTEDGPWPAWMRVSWAVGAFSRLVLSGW